MVRAVFIDRDGTLNIEKDYLYRPEEFELIPGAAEAVRMLNDAGFLVIVASNQSGIARGYYTEDDVEQLHSHASHILEASGARIDAWLYCPHHPSGRGSYSLPCACRKPEPGMLRDAARRYGIDLERSAMIGDKLVDVEAGRAAGCRLSILVKTGYGASCAADAPDGTPVCDDLNGAVRLILETAS